MKTRYLYLFLSLFMVLSFCSNLFAEEIATSATNIEVQNTTATTETKIATATPVAPIAEVPAKVKFKTGDDKTEALVVKEQGDHETIEVNLDGNAFVMKARSNKPGSRKYKEAIGNDEKQLIAEVKTKEKTIKLVDENDKLLWKVKIDGSKVKISDNEENKNPYVLKKSDGKCKVKDKAEKEIARVKYYNENGKLKLKDASGEELFVSKDYQKLSGAIGVLALNEIPAKYRAIIAAELVRQGY